MTVVKDKDDTVENRKRYLCFSLGKEDYAVPLLTVREVIAVPEVTPLPYSPPYFIGIMNLRGQIISVMDLRQKFGIKGADTSEKAVIICDIGSLCIGVVIDSVNSVINAKESDIAPPPEVRAGSGGAYIDGVYRHAQQLVLLIDIGKALSVEDKKALSGQNKAA